jgi:hypothetical protein
VLCTSSAAKAGGLRSGAVKATMTMKVTVKITVKATRRCMRVSPSP